MTGGRKGIRLRLRAAALELYGERGFDQTTTAEVAARAGVTERTYFRHFPDKREVVFDGEAALQASMAAAVEAAPDSAPLGVLRHAFLSLATRVEDDREVQARQHRVICSAPDLQERAATKAAHLTHVVADALERRGVPRPSALLAAACGTGVLDRCRNEWLAGSPRSLAEHLASAFDDLELLLRDGAAPEARPADPGRDHLTRSPASSAARTGPGGAHRPAMRTT